jgi:hypothetical protein
MVVIVDMMVNSLAACQRNKEDTVIVRINNNRWKEFRRQKRKQKIETAEVILTTTIYKQKKQRAGSSADRGEDRTHIPHQSSRMALLNPCRVAGLQVCRFAEGVEWE